MVMLWRTILSARFATQVCLTNDEFLCVNCAFFLPVFVTICISLLILLCTAEQNAKLAVVCLRFVREQIDDRRRHLGVSSLVYCEKNMFSRPIHSSHGEK